MSAHPDLRALVADEEPAPGTRRALVEHVRDCAACRAELTAREPSLLFTLLALEPAPDHVLARVQRAATAAAASEAARRRARYRRAMGAVAASLMMAGVLGTYLMLRSAGAPPPALARRAVARPSPAEVEAAAMPAGMIDILESPGDADVVEMSAGDVDLVMIFDPAMKI